MIISKELIDHWRRNLPIDVHSGLHHNRTLTQTEARDLVDALESWWLVEQLRANEGDEVHILCDNPDFNGQPNCAIEVMTLESLDNSFRFVGDTLLECLRKALAARKP